MVTSQDQNKWVIIDNDISESATKIQYGQKIQDEGLIDHLCQALAAKSCLFNSANETVEMFPHQGYTMILMSGIDWPGLLYELSEILTHHGVHIVNADLWTHKRHASAMINVVDESMGLKINDSKKLSGIKKDLGNIIKPSVKFRSPENWNVEDRSSRTRVTASNCSYRDYTRIDIRSDNRVNLLLDTISTLMVMQYVVFHGSVAVGKVKTFQEYYIRHVDGRSICRIEEREELKEALEQTISPDSEGVEVEICFDSRLIQLSKIMIDLEI